jgi:hypothetical protein
MLASRQSSLGFVAAQVGISLHAANQLYLSHVRPTAGKIQKEHTARPAATKSSQPLLGYENPH